MESYLLLLIISGLCGVSYSYSHISINEYTDFVLTETDREFAPLTPRLCRKYYYLTSCDMYYYDEKTISEYSQEYLNPTLNQWKQKSSTDSVKNVDKYYTQIYSYYNPYEPKYYYETRPSKSLYRRKRSETEQDPIVQEDKGSILQRTKRSAVGNPCVTGSEKRTIIFYAVDADYGTPVELFQDVGNQLYQYFYTRDCIRDEFEQYDCEVTFVTHIAAVYNEFNGIDIRPVKIPSSCAMTLK